MTRYLRCIETEKNKQRFYHLHLVPTLFQGWSLVREWGRVGQSGTIKIDYFDDEKSARNQLEKMLRDKLKRGYSEYTHPASN